MLTIVSIEIINNRTAYWNDYMNSVERTQKGRRKDALKR